MTSATTLLTLLNLPGYGKKRVMDVLDGLEADLDTPDRLIDYLSKSGHGPVPDKNQARQAIERANSTVEQSLDAGIQLISISDSLYPDRLKKIPDPPPVIHARGDLAGLSAAISVALIGTRDPSEYSKKSTRRIGQYLAEMDSTVVSGLALGCDTEGHLGCLEGDGVTVAVLAHGLHKVTPSSNQDLAEQILDRGGCLLSEQSVGVEPQRGFFVQRNRLQSGLSDAVILAESDLQGGSMQTVKFAEEQTRHVFCICRREGQNGEGNQMLIEAGRAEPLENRGDVEKLIEKLKNSGVSKPLPEPGPDKFTDKKQLELL